MPPALRATPPSSWVGIGYASGRPSRRSLHRTRGQRAGPPTSARHVRCYGIKAEYSHALDNGGGTSSPPAFITRIAPFRCLVEHQALDRGETLVPSRRRRSRARRDRWAPGYDAWRPPCVSPAPADIIARMYQACAERPVRRGCTNGLRPLRVPLYVRDNSAFRCTIGSRSWIEHVRSCAD